MNIDKIIMKVAREVIAYPYDEPYAFHKRFAHALLAELAKEPVGHIVISQINDKYHEVDYEIPWDVLQKLGIGKHAMYLAPIPPAVPEGWKLLGKQTEDGVIWNMNGNPHQQPIGTLIYAAPTPKEES